MENHKSLIEFYKALPNPKADFVSRMAEITKSAEATVRSWLCGSRTPDALAQSIIAKELGRPEKELFPTEPVKTNGKK